MVTLKRVNVGIQVIFCIIPYLWIYGFYRIEKLRMGLVIIVVTFVASIGIQMLLPYPYGLGTAYIFSIVLPTAFIIRWSREWNVRVVNDT